MGGEWSVSFQAALPWQITPIPVQWELGESQSRVAFVRLRRTLCSGGIQSGSGAQAYSADHSLLV